MLSLPVGGQGFQAIARRTPEGSRIDGEPRWIHSLGGGALRDLGCYPLHALRTLPRAKPTVRSAEAAFDVSGPTSHAARLDHMLEVMGGRIEPLTGGEDAMGRREAIDAIHAAAGRPPD